MATLINAFPQFCSHSCLETVRFEHPFTILCSLIPFVVNIPLIHHSWSVSCQFCVEVYATCTSRVWIHWMLWQEWRRTSTEVVQVSNNTFRWVYCIWQRLALVHTLSSLKLKNEAILTSFSCILPVMTNNIYTLPLTGPPTFPFNCQVFNQTDHSLYVICVFDTEKSSNVSWNSNHLFPAKWQDKTRILVHPRTHYVCEVYHLTSSHLLANVTTVITELPNSFSTFPYLGTKRSPQGKDSSNCLVTELEQR